MTRNVSHLERSDSAEGEDDDENDWSVCTGAEEDPPPGLGDAASFTGIKTHRQALRSAVFRGISPFSSLTDIRVHMDM